MAVNEVAGDQLPCAPVADAVKARPHGDGAVEERLQADGAPANEKGEAAVNGKGEVAVAAAAVDESGGGGGGGGEWQGRRWRRRVCMAADRGRTWRRGR